jgi:hypothetical protein
VVLPDSHEISRAPCYSGTRQGVTPVSRTGLSPPMVPLSSGFRYQHDLSLPARPADRAQRTPQPPPRNPCRVSRATGLAWIPFRSPLLRESRLLSLPAGTEMFHFPALPPPPYAFRRKRHPMTGARFPHSETPGSQPGCRLPGEYRRLQRPSSAPGAKASTVCP